MPPASHYYKQSDFWYWHFEAMAVAAVSYFRDHQSLQVLILLRLLHISFAYFEVTH